ncbi:MAG: hypothetical protein ACREOB_03030 [Thermodesulfobacteriota bacterium]
MRRLLIALTLVCFAATASAGQGQQRAFPQWILWSSIFHPTKGMPWTPIHKLDSGEECVHMIQDIARRTQALRREQGKDSIDILVSGTSALFVYKADESDKGEPKPWYSILTCFPERG